MPIKQSVGSKTSGGGDISIFGARVISIILEDKSYPQEFAKNGKWSAVGSVFFSKLNESNASKSALSNNIAKPLFPNSSVIPLKNEVIYISRANVPYEFKNQLKYQRKHLSIVSFKPEALLTFGKSKISELEKIEDIELLRALDIGLKIKTLHLKG